MSSVIDTASFGNFKNNLAALLKNVNAQHAQMGGAVCRVTRKRKTSTRKRTTTRKNSTRKRTTRKRTARKRVSRKRTCRVR